MEDKTFELIEKMYSDFSERFKEINQKLDQKSDKTDIIVLENKLDEKTSILFDVNKQHTEQLNRIEQEVSRHEEIILRRIK